MTVNRMYVLLQDADAVTEKMKKILDCDSQEKELTLADISTAKNVITDLAEFVKGLEIE